MDVKSAFLYGKIAEEVYVIQPRGFEDPDHLKKVYKVVKALYGLHQAHRACTSISTASPSRVLNDGEPSYSDDPLMPHLEDIYASPSEEYTPFILKLKFDPMLAVQTRSKVNKNSEAHALISKALKDESWIDAMQEELLQFQIQKEEGIDYDEVFAPVAKIEAIRIFLDFASYMGFIVYQMDVKSAFLYGTVDEEVYVIQPPGFVDPKFHNKVYKVVKALYGLHQAPRAWYATLFTSLEKSRYRRGAIDKTLFIKQDKKDIMLVQVYVDDIIFGSTKKSWCDEFKEIIKNRFQMSSMGELTFFLRLHVKQKDDGIFISLDKFQVTPKTSHLQAVKRIFRYLKGQPKLGLWYPKVSSFDLEAYSDSDYASTNLDRKSTTGGCQILGRRLFLWQCKKQTIMATFTTEAEYVVAAHCYGQVLWIHNHLLDYGFNIINIKIYIDNESIICIVKNPVFHSKTKHIDIRHHFIRDAYEKKLIHLLKIHTDDNVADLLTKAYDVSSFKFLIVDFLNAQVIQYVLMVNLTIYVSCIKQFWAMVLIKKTNDVVKLRALIDGKRVEKDDVEVPNAPTPPSPTTTPSPPPQEPITTSLQAQPAPPSSPPQEPPTTTSESSMTLLSNLRETCATLSQKVATLEQDKVAQALEILKLKRRVKKLEKQRRFKSLGGCIQTGGRIKAIDADEDITLVDAETQVDLGAELQGRKDDDNVAAKEVSATEPTVFDDEEVTMTMAQTLIKMKAKKARLLDEQMAKRLHDEEVEHATAREKQEKDDLEQSKVLQQQYDDRQENIDWNLKPEKNMIIYLKNMAGYKIKHFRGMTYDKVRPIFEREYNKVQTLFVPDKDVEEHSKKRVAEETLLQESFEKLKAVEVSSSYSTQDTPTHDPKEINEDLHGGQQTKEQKFGYILQVIKKLELKKLDSLLVFRDILNICLRVSGQEFDETPSEEEALSFIYELGHSGEIKNKDTQVYGAILPKAITNQAMLDSVAYKSYYAIASGAEPPKSKKSQKKYDSAISSKESPSKKKPASKPKRLRRRHCKKDFHISQASGSSDGTNFQSGVPDEQQRNISSIDEGTGAKPDDEENKEELDYGEELYKDVNVNLRKEDVEMTDADHSGSNQHNISQELGFKQEEEDAHVTLTTAHDTQKIKGPMQSSSFSSDFTEKLLNFENISSADNEIASLMDTIVCHEEPSQIKQVDRYAQAISSILAIVDRYIDNKLGEAIHKAIQSHNTECREEAQAKKQEYIDLVDSSVNTIIREEVKTQLPQILPKAVSDFSTYEAATSLSKYELMKILLDKMEESKSHLRADYKRELYDALVKSYKTDKDLFKTYGEVFTLKRSQDKKDKDQDPSAGSDRGMKRRKSSKETEVSGQEFDEPPSEEEALSFIYELGHSGEIKNKDTQVYGAILPKAITNQAMLYSVAYKSYYAIASGAEPPKSKKSQKKYDLAISSKESPSKKKPASKPKRLRRRHCKKDFHISQASGSSDGTNFQSGVPDVPKYDSKSDKESWGNSGKKDDNDEDDTKDDEGNDDDDSDHVRTKSDIDKDPNLNQFNEEHEQEEENADEFTDKEDDEENKEELDDGEELYKDVNVNLRKEDVEMTDADQSGANQHNVSQELGFKQEEEDAHVTLTTAHDTQKIEGPMQSSSFSSDFTKKLLNFENISLADNEIASLMDTTVCHEEPSQIKQVDRYAQAISSILAIVDRYIDNKLGEAIHKAIQSHNAECREEAQAKKQEYIDVVDSSVSTIIREEVKTQLPQILPKAVSDFATPVIERNIT
nr:hypothetical protein [Tanacetum cinerariifolium]